jgi:hypothetical protein
MENDRTARRSARTGFALVSIMCSAILFSTLSSHAQGVGASVGAEIGGLGIGAEAGIGTDGGGVGVGAGVGIGSDSGGIGAGVGAGAGIGTDSSGVGAGAGIGAGVSIGGTTANASLGLGAGVPGTGLSGGSAPGSTSDTGPGASQGAVAAAVAGMSPTERQRLRKTCAQVLANPAAATPVNVALCRLVVASN